MKILVFDTETTGLPAKNAHIYNTNDWPYIVQLSYIFYDTNTHIVLDICDNIIKLPPHITITKESENIHKISNEISQTHGIDIKHALLEFKNCCDSADRIVGHNINFDKNIVIVESLRNNINRIFSPTESFYCTMKYSKYVCKIEKISSTGKSYYKFPKLIELYKHYFNDEPDNLHNSMIDVIITLRCYGMLEDNIDYNTVSSNLNAVIGLASLGSSL